MFNKQIKGPPSLRADLIQHRIGLKGHGLGKTQRPTTSTWAWRRVDAWVPLEGGERFQLQHQHRTNKQNKASNTSQANINANARTQRTGNSSLLSVMACRGPTGLLDLLPDSSGLNFNEGDGTSKISLAPRNYTASSVVHVGKPCRPPAPHRLVYGLQHASSQLRRRQGLSLPFCGEHACTQAACFPNSRALTFDVHTGLQLTSHV